MKISFRTVALWVLVIGAAVHLVYFFLLSIPKDRTLYNFYTFIGGYISVVGILFTLIQLKSVREEAKAIKDSVSSYNNILTLVEVSNLAGLLAEARGNIITQDIRTAHQKLTFLKPSVITLTNRIAKQGILFENEDNPISLKDLVFDFRSDIRNLDESLYNYKNFDTIDFTIVLKHMDDLLTYFLHLAEHLKSQNHES